MATSPYPFQRRLCNDDRSRYSAETGSSLTEPCSVVPGPENPGRSSVDQLPELSDSPLSGHDRVSFQRRLRAVDRRISNDDARKGCGETGLGAIVTGGRQPQIVGLVETCGQNACPRCADREMDRWRREIRARIEHWTQHGMSAVGVTFTAPHRSWHDFHEVRDWLESALRGLFAGRQGEAFRRSVRIGPIDKAWETTWTVEGGPHPHVHAVFYLLFRANETDIADLTSRLQDRWSGLMQQTDAPIWDVNEAAVGQRGVFVRDIESPAAAARYLVKSTVEWDRNGEFHATGMFRLLEQLAKHEDAFGEPCYCIECKRNVAVWRAFADPRNPLDLPDRMPAWHAKRYAGRPRISPARRFNDACSTVGIEGLNLVGRQDRETGLCRIRYDAIRVVHEQAAERRVADAAGGGLEAVRQVVLECYEEQGVQSERARALAGIQVTEPPPWTRRIGLASRPPAPVPRGTRRSVPTDSGSHFTPRAGVWSPKPPASRD